MYQSVIFDLDGTLLDTLEDLADATNWVCTRHGWPNHPVPAFKEYVGNGAEKLLERVLPADVEQTDELKRQLYNEFTGRYTAHSGDKTTVYAGMPELISKVKAAGVTVAVLTNKPHEAAKPVVERYYPGLFDHVQGALPDMPTKPDPTLLLRLMEQIGADPACTLFVGDSNVDIRTAKNGGLPGCGVLWGFRSREELLGEGADYLAASASELEQIILG